MYKQFGVMNIVRSMAKKELLKYEDIFHQPYSVVFMERVASLIDYTYEKKLSKIKMDNAKASAS